MDEFDLVHSCSRSRKSQNHYGNPRITPKRIRKILLFKNFKTTQKFQQNFEQRVAILKTSVHFFWKSVILGKLYHILMLCMVLDFERIFENFETWIHHLDFKRFIFETKFRLITLESFSSPILSRFFRKRCNADVSRIAAKHRWWQINYFNWLMSSFMRYASFGVQIVDHCWQREFWATVMLVITLCQ